MDNIRTFNSFHRSPQQNDGAGVQVALEQTVRGLLRWKKYLVLSLAIAVLTGLTAALLLQSRKYTFEGALLYTPNEITAPYYRPPLLGNLVHVVDTPAVLEELNKRCQLGADLAELRRNVTAELVPSGDTLIVRVIRPDLDEARRVLDTAMQCYADETRKISKQALGRFVKEFESNLQSAQDSFEKVNKELQAFLDEHDLKTPAGVEELVSTLQGSITDLDLELEMARIELASAEAKRDRLRSMHAEQQAAEVATTDGTTQKVKLPIGASDNDHRQFLRDQIDREQKTSSYAVKLSVKERERERVKSLHDQGLVSDAEMERIDGELAILRAEQTARVSQLQGQLSQVEQRLAKRLGGRSEGLVGSGVVLAGFSDQPQLLEQSLALLELDILGAQHKANHLAKKFESKLQELDQVSQLQKEIGPLALAVTQAADEKLRLQSLVEQFEQAHDSEVDELKVVQSPTPSIDGVRSNASKIFGAGLIGTLGLLIAPVLLLEWSKQTRRTPENVARDLGLPVLADLSREKAIGETTATAALRIQRKLPEHNAVLLAVGCSGRSHVLARALAQCGESVVVVDLEGNVLKKLDKTHRSHQTKQLLRAGASVSGESNSVEIATLPDSLGITDYLRGEAAENELIIQPSEEPNLSYLGCGSSLLASELLDQVRLKNITAELKTRFSVVLLSGVRLNQRLRLECLIDCADRIVICSSEDILDAESLEAARELIKMNVNVLGIIV